MAKKSAILLDMATFFKALADENRLRIILCLLSSFPESMTVSEIVEKLAISQPLTSHHLKELRYAGIVSSKRKGPFIHYQLVSGDIVNVVRDASEWLERYGNGEYMLPQEISNLLQNRDIN